MKLMWGNIFTIVILIAWGIYSVPSWRKGEPAEWSTFMLFFVAFILTRILDKLESR